MKWNILLPLHLTVAGIIGASVDFSSAKMRQHPSYNFRYTVSDENSGDFKSQTEQWNASTGVITGMYKVLQPDGCVRVVHYTADATGFHPKVTYEGSCQSGRLINRKYQPIQSIPSDEDQQGPYQGDFSVDDHLDQHKHQRILNKLVGQSEKVVEPMKKQTNQSAVRFTVPGSNVRSFSDDVGQPPSESYPITPTAQPLLTEGEISLASDAPQITGIERLNPASAIILDYADRGSKTNTTLPTFDAPAETASDHKHLTMEKQYFEPQNSHVKSPYVLADSSLVIEGSGLKPGSSSHGGSFSVDSVKEPVKLPTMQLKFEGSETPFQTLNIDLSDEATLVAAMDLDRKKNQNSVTTTASTVITKESDLFILTADNELSTPEVNTNGLETNSTIKSDSSFSKLSELNSNVTTTFDVGETESPGETSEMVVPFLGVDSAREVSNRTVTETRSESIRVEVFEPSQRKEPEEDSLEINKVQGVHHETPKEYKNKQQPPDIRNELASLRSGPNVQRGGYGAVYSSNGAPGNQHFIINNGIGTSKHEPRGTFAFHGHPHHTYRPMHAYKPSYRHNNVYGSYNRHPYGFYTTFRSAVPVIVNADWHQYFGMHHDTTSIQPLSAYLARNFPGMVFTN